MIFQKDHVTIQLDNLMESYSPSVGRESYKIIFVPVVLQNDSEEEIQRRLNYDSVAGKTYVWCHICVSPPN